MSSSYLTINNFIENLEIINIWMAANDLCDKYPPRMGKNPI